MTAIAETGTEPPADFAVGSEMIAPSSEPLPVTHKVGKLIIRINHNMGIEVVQRTNQLLSD